METGLLEKGLLGNSTLGAEHGMRDMIGTTFVIVFFLDYLVIFGVLVNWAIHTWRPRAGGTSDAQRSHEIPHPH